MKTTLFAAAILGLGVFTLAAASNDAPKIQFERTVYDFGKTSQVATVSGVFKFKNTGDSVLKVEPPKPSCGCTVTDLKSDTLRPGETGELGFTLHLGLVKAQFDKQIAVKSNDPETPEVSLSVKADYTPMYDISPLTLTPNIPFGEEEAVRFATLTRTDGKSLDQMRFVTSKPWITATLERGTNTDEATARIRVEVQREGPPRRFSEFVQIYAAGPTNPPVASIYIFGQIMGEVALSPEALYWSVTDAAKPTSERVEAQVLRRLTIRSAEGKAIELKNPQSSIKGINVELVSKEAGKIYELLARLDVVPAGTVSGNVSFETSVASQPRIEVPVIINVFNP